ncbi:hypothetical protein PV04_08013 [Phialophora macrospora]|uniref:Fungal N-terminal domain-containing protein n=1 Tax=Phialophora macrospora TaxID=1851006 RepID=A0A0D2FCP0_9EURO|nr:hypothetical protein PV04_08013 [Phialophora macrospora]
MAAFGVGIGDIIAVSKLSINLYRGCKGADGVYDALSSEVDRFCSTIRSLQQTLPTQESIDTSIDRSQNYELHNLLRSAQSDLSQWVEVLHKHRKVGAGSRWANIRFSTADDATTIRRRLASHTQSLTLFMSTMTSRRIGNIESHLERILSEVQTGARDFSVEVEPEDDTIMRLEEAQWEMLKAELLTAGFVQEDIASHKSWFEERLRVVDGTAIPTDLPTPASSRRASAVSPAANEFVLRLRSANFSIQCEDGRLLRCEAGDEFAFMSVVDVRPGRPDLWQCRHIDSCKVVTLEASCLEPGRPRGTDVFRQFTLSKGFQSSSTLTNQGSGDAPSRRSKPSPTMVRSGHPNSVRPSMRSRPSSQTITTQDSSAKSDRKRRTNSDPVRGRSTSITSTPPARPRSRPHSVRSEISEYGPDGKLVTTKTFTMTYSTEAIPSLDGRSVFLHRPHTTTLDNVPQRPRPGEPSGPSNQRDYEAMYKERTSQLKLL